jgi:hypothetical protein
MPKAAEFAKPPADLGVCKDCRWWLATAANVAVKLPNGAIITAEDYRRAPTIVAGAVEFSQAPCAFSPQWVMQPSEGWCGQWNATVRREPTGVAKPRREQLS